MGGLGKWWAGYRVDYNTRFMGGFIPAERTANGGALHTTSWEYDIGVNGVPNWQRYPRTPWSLWGLASARVRSLK